MDKRENDEQNEVEVHLFAEEDFNDGLPAEETPQGEITVDFGEARPSPCSTTSSPIASMA